jgi:hypothetical protein
VNLQGSAKVVKSSTAVLATLAVLVLPGGSLIVGGLWLYRYAREAANRRQKEKLQSAVGVALNLGRGTA